MDAIRIAMISVHGNPLVPDHLLGSEGKGGQNVYVRSMGQALSRQGCDVTWFTRSESPDEIGTVEKSPSLRLRYIIAGPQEYIHRDNLFLYLAEFASHINPNDFDVIFTNYWLSGYVGLCLNAPQVHAHHSLGCVKYASLNEDQLPSIAPTRLKVEQELNRRAACVFNLNCSDRKLCKPKRSVIVRLGVELSTFSELSKPDVKNELGFADDEFNILYVGRFAHQKGVKYACDAMKDLKIRHKFRLVGDYSENMPEGPERYPDFKFLGSKGRSDVARYMSASDIVVIPSVYEPGGLVAVEAMAAGAVLVSTTVGGLGEFVTDSNGIKVPPRSSESIRSAIEELAASPKRMRNMSQHNKDTAHKFSWDAQASVAVAEIRRILEHRRKPTETRGQA